MDIPRVKKLELCNNHDYITESNMCSCVPKNIRIRYCVSGTDYGYLRNTSGDIHIWRTYSGAYAAMRKYKNRS